jgi:hypothetical protein
LPIRGVNWQAGISEWLQIKNPREARGANFAVAERRKRIEYDDKRMGRIQKFPVELLK